MKALILNGERQNEDTLDVLYPAVVREAAAAGWEAEGIILRDRKIANCMGCFRCWTKTPGLCVIDDFGRELAGKVANSDLLVFLTPITFGGYSSELKKAIDRFADPMLMPFFMKIRGEVHHKPRYEPLPSLAAMGVLPRPDDESEGIFSKLVKRNAINLHSPLVKSAVFYASDGADDVGARVGSLLAEVKK